MQLTGTFECLINSAKISNFKIFVVTVMLIRIIMIISFSCVIQVQVLNVQLKYFTFKYIQIFSHSQEQTILSCSIKYSVNRSNEVVILHFYIFTSCNLAVFYSMIGFILL